MEKCDSRFDSMVFIIFDLCVCDLGRTELSLLGLCDKVGILHSVCVYSFHDSGVVFLCFLFFKFYLPEGNF